MKKFFKWLSLTVGVLLVGITIFVVFFLEDVLVNKLSNELNRTFEKYYTIDYKDITTSVGWNGLSITIDQPVFSSDTSKHKLNEKFPTLFFKSSRLYLKNISIRKLFFTNDLELDQIKLSKPSLRLILFDAAEEKNNTQVPAKRKKRHKNTLMIGKIAIEDGNIACSNYKSLSDTTFMGYKINSRVEKISVRVSQLKKLAYTLKAENKFTFSIDKAFYQPYHSNYFFYMDSLFLDDKIKVITAKNILADALKSKMTISKSFQYAKTIAETSIGAFHLKGYHLKELVLQNSIVLQSLTLDQVDLDMFKNRKKELDKNKEKLLIQEMLTGLPFTVLLDSLKITNSQLSFEIIDHQTKSPVGFKLTELNILLTKINSNPEAHDTVILNGSGKLFNTTRFDIQLLFPDIHEDESYYTGRIGRMSFKSFNPILSSYSGIRIVDGDIHSISFSGKCDKYENHGSLVFRYNNLEIESQKTGKDGVRKKARLISKLGNMILQNNNPRKAGEEAERFSYHLRREKYRGHVFLLFGGVLEGVKNTLLDKDLQDKIKKFRLVERYRQRQK